MNEAFQARAEQADWALSQGKRGQMVFVDAGKCIACGTYAIYAPAHSHTLRAILVDDPEIIQTFDRAVMRFNERLYNLLYRPRLLRALIPRMAAQRAAEYRKVQPRLERALDTGRAYTSPPAAFVFLVDDRRTPLAWKSAQYALYNVVLYAQTKGIGCRNLVGNQMIFNGSSEVRERLGLQKNERCYGTVGLGIPPRRPRFATSSS